MTKFNPAAAPICDAYSPWALPEGPVNEIPMDSDPIPVGERSPGLLQHPYDFGVVHSDTHVLQQLPGVQMDLFATLSVQPHDLPSS
jgi:hypothetical protein